MERLPPPKHRHDGTSPLPLGMDWSPPPRKWNGRDTVWPHDPHSGWSYCVTIPSWVVLPKSRNSDPVVVLKLNESPVFIYTQVPKERSQMLEHQTSIMEVSGSKPVGCSGKEELDAHLPYMTVLSYIHPPFLYERVQVGIQSPEGVTSTRGVLRRFNDFLKLSVDLKKAHPKKSLPPAPPKGLLRMKSRELLEERRCSLEEWMTKLLSDIDVSRSIAVASFLELEAAARSSFQDESQKSSESNSASSSIISSVQLHPHSSLSVVAGSSSITSDCGSDTAYETSELGTPRLGRDDSSDFGIEDLTLDEDLTSPMEKLVKFGISNIDEGLFMGQTILEQLEGLPRHKMHGRQANNIVRKESDNGNASQASFLAGNSLELFSEQDHRRVIGHARKLSSDSIGSDVSSHRGSEISNSGIPNSSTDSSRYLHGHAEVSSTKEIFRNRELLQSGDAQIVLPLDQRHKMNRVLMTMQRRLVTAKTDMEDLIARLNQEIAVKGYLTTKVKDLEEELESTKQKSKENLQQAILVERERFTQMQWDMEELRRKSLEMELKLKSEQTRHFQDEKSHIESTREASMQEKDVLQPELDATKEQLQNLLKRYEELEAKSKADIKVLVKEVKSLRRSQAKLQQELTQSLKEKSEAEELLEHEKQTGALATTSRQKVLHECRILLTRLQECDINLSLEDENRFVEDSSSIADAFDLLTRSDNQIGLLLGEARFFSSDNDIDNSRTEDDELRILLADIFKENARLRKQVNSVTQHALRNVMSKRDYERSPEENS